jgi:ABC-type thiamin/hydroxymethylpyrimidine transport system permease subunit
VDCQAVSFVWNVLATVTTLGLPLAWGIDTGDDAYGAFVIVSIVFGLVCASDGDARSALLCAAVAFVMMGYVHDLGRCFQGDCAIALKDGAVFAGCLAVWLLGNLILRPAQLELL